MPPVKSLWLLEKLGMFCLLSSPLSPRCFETMLCIKLLVLDVDRAMSARRFDICNNVSESMLVTQDRWKLTLEIAPSLPRMILYQFWVGPMGVMDAFWPLRRYSLRNLLLCSTQKTSTGAELSLLNFNVMYFFTLLYIRLYFCYFIWLAHCMFTTVYCY